jgi:hypothetical protein
MAKTAHTHEHPSREPKKGGCCGESHAKDEKAQRAAQERIKIPSDTEREHAHHAVRGSCCCGSGKKGTSQPKPGDRS